MIAPISTANGMTVVVIYLAMLAIAYTMLLSSIASKPRRPRPPRTKRKCEAKPGERGFVSPLAGNKPQVQSTVMPEGSPSFNDKAEHIFEQIKNAAR